MWKADCLSFRRDRPCPVSTTTNKNRDPIEHEYRLRRKLLKPAHMKQEYRQDVIKSGTRACPVCTTTSLYNNQ